MLENLIEKYKKEDVNEVVYRLTYGKKFIIVKGKTLSGSLFVLMNDWYFFIKSDRKNSQSLYSNFFNWIEQCILEGREQSKFTIRILAQTNSKTDHYRLLRAEQLNLDKHQGSPDFLGKATEAYIPQWNELRGKYNWLNKEAVIAFKRHLISKPRLDRLRLYKSINKKKVRDQKKAHKKLSV
jgi:hypothetical protein